MHFDLCIIAILGVYFPYRVVVVRCGGSPHIQCQQGARDVSGSVGVNGNAIP